MCSKLFCLLLLVSTLVLTVSPGHLSATEASGRARANDRYDAVMRAIGENHIQEALTLLDTMIAGSPEDIPALGIRSQLLLEAGDVSGSLRDVEAVLEKSPVKEGMLLNRCVILESQTHDKEEARLCYVRAASTLEQHYSEEELKKNGEYVRLLILSASPQAKAAVQWYIKSLDPHNDLGQFEIRAIQEFNHGTLLPIIEAIHAAQAKAAQVKAATP